MAPGEIGRVTTGAHRAGAWVVEPVFIEWDTTGLPAAVAVVAVIDPENSEAETAKATTRSAVTLRCTPAAKQ
ncbi:MAG: hypothetical protein R3E79_04280 [Caldilineaceae bacterium]